MYKAKITLDHTKVAAPLSDLPVLVRLTSPGVFAAIGANSKRLKIADVGGQPLYAEVETWDPVSALGRLWLKVPAVSSILDTVLDLTADSSFPDTNAYIGGMNSPAGEAVWSNGYAAVYHLTEQGAGVAGEYKDSTKNHLHATAGTGSRKAPTRVQGPLGYQQNFLGDGGLILLPDNNVFSPISGKMVLSYWMSINTLINPTVTSAGQLHYIGKIDEWSIVLYNQPDGIDGTRSGRHSFYIFNPAGGQGAGWYWSETDSIPVGQDIFAAARFIVDGGLQPVTYRPTYAVHAADNGLIAAYKNGVNKGSRHWQDGQYDIHPLNGANPVYIGGRMTYAEYFNGKIGELRFASVDRADAWIAAERAAQNGTLAAVTDIAVSKIYSGVLTADDGSQADVEITVSNA